MEFFEETEEQKMVADYFLYIQLKKLNYSDSEIANQFHCAVEYLDKIKALFH